ncbi:hypothetical protein D3C72_841070 [compost metagenome]
MQIELRFRDAGFGHGYLGIGLRQLGDGIVEFLLGTNIGPAQLLLPVGGLPRLKLRGLRPAQRAFGAVDTHLKRRGIDPIENIAFLHQRALFEHPLHDDAGDTRTHFGKPRRRNASGQFVGNGKLFLLHRHDLHGTGRRRAGR